MRIRISNMLRVESANLHLEPGRITCVAGKNAAGKTSLATIVGAMLTGEGNPVGASKGMGKVYLRDGADAGFAELTGDDGDMLARWVAQTGELARVVEGDMPCSSAGVGLVDFTGQMSPAARVALWEEYFLPPAEVLEARIRKALAPYVSENLLEELMEHGRADGGFDGIVKAYQARGREAKRAWTRITGEEWGQKKAADWLPDGWMADLDGATREAAQKAFEAAEADVQSAQISHAVDATLIAQAAEAAEQVPALTAAYNAARADAELARDACTKHLDAGAPILAELERVETGLGEARAERQALDRRIKEHRVAKPDIPEGDAIFDDNESLRAQERAVRIKIRKPQREMFVSGVAARQKRVGHLRANEPKRESIAQGVPCPACNAPLIVEDMGRAISHYDMEAAAQEADQRHAKALEEWEAEIARLEDEIKAIYADADAACETAMVEWQAYLDEANQELVEARESAREKAMANAEFWATEQARMQTQLETVTAKVEDFTRRLPGVRAPHEAHEAAFQELHEANLRAKAALDEAQVALETQKRLAGQADGKVAETEEMLEAQAAAERELERARTHKTLVGKRLDAREQHENVIAYQTIAQLLGPKGVRAQAVEEAMARFDGVLNTIAVVTGWPRVALDRNYAISIGDRKLLRLCAESERLRAQWCLQIAVTRVRREPVAILDAADHLDQENLYALRTLLAALCDRPTPPAFLVCGTELDHEVLNPGGITYALEDGRLREI